MGGAISKDDTDSLPLKRPTNPDRRNGAYLRTLMPNRDLPVRKNYMDEMEDACWRFIEDKAAEGYLSCRYTVSDITPGMPLYDPEKVMRELFQRIVKYPDIQAYADPDRLNTLVISWAQRVDSRSSRGASPFSSPRK